MVPFVAPALVVVILGSIATYALWSVLSGDRTETSAGGPVRPGTPPPAGDSDVWPNLHGPLHNGIVPGVSGRVRPWGPEGPAERWRVPCGTGYGAPIVWRDRVVLLHRLGDEEVVGCLDVESGETLWEHRYPTAFECRVNYTDGPYSTPATDGEFVYAIGAEAKLHCLELADGDVVWQRDLRAEFDVPEELFGVGHSPLVWRDLVILNVGGREPDSGIVAFDKRSGGIVWRATDHPAGYATPQPATIHGREWLFVLTGEGLVALDPADGDVRWTLAYRTEVPDHWNCVTPVVSGDLVFVTIYGKGATVLRVLPDGGYETVWESNRALTVHYTNVVPRDGHAYGVHFSDKSQRCIDLATGEVRWRWRSPLDRSTRIAIGESLVLLGEHGRLGLVDLTPTGLVERALTDESLFPGEAVYSAPAHATGRLYLRSERFAVCLELPME